MNDKACKSFIWKDERERARTCLYEYVCALVSHTYWLLYILWEGSIRTDEWTEAEVYLSECLKKTHRSVSGIFAQMWYIGVSSLSIQSVHMKCIPLYSNIAHEPKGIRIKTHVSRLHDQVLVTYILHLLSGGSKSDLVTNEDIEVTSIVCILLCIYSVMVRQWYVIVKDFMCAVIMVIFGESASVRLVVMSSINPVINLNPMSSHKHMTIYYVSAAINVYT